MQNVWDAEEARVVGKGDQGLLQGQTAAITLVRRKRHELPVSAHTARGNVRTAHSVHLARIGQVDVQTSAFKQLCLQVLAGRGSPHCRLN